MEELGTWSALFLESLRGFGEKIASAIPGIVLAILILLLGWLVAHLVSGAISRLLRLVKMDALGERIQADEVLKRANIQLKPSALIGKVVYWILLLLVIITAAETLGWNALSAEISNLLGYLPKLLIAIVFFVVGTYIAGFVRDFIHSAARSLGIAAGRLISAFVFYLLFIIVTLTALRQAGVDTTIITSNLLLILGAILASAAISYGFASREILANILAGFFSRQTFKPGQVIEFDGDRGEIVATSSISVTIRNAAGDDVVIPTHQLITHKVKIIRDEE